MRDLPTAAPKTGGRTEKVGGVSGERVVIPAIWSPRFRLVVQP
jgi:hypothetical protein